MGNPDVTVGGMFDIRRAYSSSYFPKSSDEFRTAWRVRKRRREPNSASAFYLCGQLSFELSVVEYLPGRRFPSTSLKYNRQAFVSIPNIFRRSRSLNFHTHPLPHIEYTNAVDTRRKAIRIMVGVTPTSIRGPQQTLHQSYKIVETERVGKKKEGCYYA